MGFQNVKDAVVVSNYNSITRSSATAVAERPHDCVLYVIETLKCSLGVT